MFTVKSYDPTTSELVLSFSSVDGKRTSFSFLYWCMRNELYPKHKDPSKFFPSSCETKIHRALGLFYVIYLLGKNEYIEFHHSWTAKMFNCGEDTAAGYMHILRDLSLIKTSIEKVEGTIDNCHYISKAGIPVKDIWRYKVNDENVHVRQAEAVQGGRYSVDVILNFPNEIASKFNISFPSKSHVNENHDDIESSNDVTNDGDALKNVLWPLFVRGIKIMDVLTIYNRNHSKKATLEQVVSEYEKFTSSYNNITSWKSWLDSVLNGSSLDDTIDRLKIGKENIDWLFNGGLYPKKHLF